MTGTRNTLGDLNNILFEQLERLSKEKVDSDSLKSEIERSKAVTGVASKVIENGSLVLDAHKVYDDRMDADNNLPKMLKSNG